MKTADATGVDGAPTETPTRYRRPLAAPITEIVLLLLLLLVAALALRAGSNPESVGDPLAHVGDFYRRVVLGSLKGHLIPLSWLLLACGGGLVLLAVWPGAAPASRGAVMAYAMLLLLAPVLNYGPQVETLSMYPEDVQILAAELPPEAQAKLETEHFHPFLPVTWPLLAGLVVLVAWAVATPVAEWPVTVKAGGALTLLLVCGGRWLIASINLARGEALSFPYTQWPHLIAAVWIVGQLGVAMTAAAALGVDPKRSRVASLCVALACVVTALSSGGGH